MQKRTVFKYASLILLPVLAFFTVRSVRNTHYPVPVEVKPEWAPYVESLDAQNESLFIDSDGTLLEADLFIPNGGQSQKPAVIFTGGSGDGIYQSYSREMIEKYVLGVFLERDMAVLLVNKRGMGQSEGNYVSNSIEGRAADMYAALQTLQSHPAIDPDNIGLIGHSQGGWVVTEAAGTYPEVAFFINLAGPTMTGSEQAQDMYSHEARCKGLEGEDAEKYIERRVFGTDISVKLGQATNFGYFGFDARLMFYNPETALKTTSSPGLYVFGEHDVLVTPALNIERMNELFDNEVPDRLTVVTIDDATHGFELVSDPCDAWGDTSTYSMSQELVVVLNDWLVAQGY
jgi:pimeloyl-ACP methyl ester carboxylesterase